MKIRKKLRYCLRSVLGSIECGRHSGFNTCCVLYYSLISEPSYYFWPWLYHEMRTLNHIFIRKREKHYLHIPCPLCCLLDRAVSPESIRKCSPSYVVDSMDNTHANPHDIHRYRFSDEEIAEIREDRAKCRFDQGYRKSEERAKRFVERYWKQP
jgi:hypothetical protein